MYVATPNVDKLFLLKIVSKTKKQKKKKAILTGRTGQRPKGNGISPEGWRSHYAVSFWSGSGSAVRRTFAAFLFFFAHFQTPLKTLLSHCTPNADFESNIGKSTSPSA